MQPPLTPAQLAAQKYTEVQNYDELIEAGVGEPFPILNGPLPGGVDVLS